MTFDTIHQALISHSGCSQSFSFLGRGLNLFLVYSYLVSYRFQPEKLESLIWCVEYLLSYLALCLRFPLRSMVVSRKNTPLTDCTH